MKRHPPLDPKLFLTTDNLILRWQSMFGILYNSRTLENWRYLEKPRGPKSIKVMGRRVYRLKDVESYENSGEIEKEIL